MEKMAAQLGALLLTLVVAAPAAAQEASEDPQASGTGVTVEVLNGQAVIPLEAIPEDADHITFARSVIEPGVSGEGPSYQPQRWTNLEYADQGWTRGTSAERSRVWHADGTTVDVPAGAPQDLAAGDVELYYNGAAPGTFENPGTDTYVSFFLGVGNSLSPETGSAPPPGVDWQRLDYIFPGPEQLDAWLAAPIAVTFQRITLEPGASMVVTPEEVPMLTFSYYESGETMWAARDAADTTVPQNGAKLPTGMAVHWSMLPPDRVFVLWNPGEVPSVLIQAVLSPASE
jgi:hypothetical protein